MQLSILLAHPNRDSFNHAIAQVVLAALRENGHQVIWHDLFGVQFDPSCPMTKSPRRPRCHPRWQCITGTLRPLTA